MGADQNFSEIRIVGLCPKTTANPPTQVSENSYGQAISKQKTQVAARKQSESKCRTRLQRPVRPVAQTGQTGRAGNSNCRPVRPVVPRQPANKAPNVKSRANEVQIERNLEENFASTP